MNQFFIINLFKNKLSKAVVFTIKCALEWPGGLVKTLLALPYSPSPHHPPMTPLVSDSIGLGWGLRICIYYMFPDEAAANWEPQFESHRSRYCGCKKKKRVLGNRLQYLWLLHITSCVIINEFSFVGNASIFIYETGIRVLILLTSHG